MDEETFQQYAKAWRKRQKDEENKRTKRLGQAGETAKKLAEMLMQNWGAKEVWLLGSKKEFITKKPTPFELRGIGSIIHDSSGPGKILSGSYPSAWRRT